MPAALLGVPVTERALCHSGLSANRYRWMKPTGSPFRSTTKHSVGSTPSTDGPYRASMAAMSCSSRHHDCTCGCANHAASATSVLRPGSS